MSHELPTSEPQHIYGYSRKLCEARPGDIPMMVPKSGEVCPICQRLYQAFKEALVKAPPPPKPL